MRSLGDFIVTVVLGTGTYMYFQSPEQRSSLIRRLISPLTSHRLHFTDKNIQVYGKKNKKYWGTIVSDLGDQWEMNNKRKIYKNNLDITYYLVDTSF